jgi:hypothetical protein
LEPGERAFGDDVVEPAVGAVDGDGRVHAGRHTGIAESAGRRFTSVPALWCGRDAVDSRGPRASGGTLEKAIYSTNTMPQAADQEKTYLRRNVSVSKIGSLGRMGRMILLYREISFFSTRETHRNIMPIVPTRDRSLWRKEILWGHGSKGRCP